MRSPGRPPVGRREHRQRFWAAIARGGRSDAAGVEAGVSPVVGVRWFREAGGVSPISQAPLSGRCLSFAEREEIAVLRAGGCGVREVARRLGRSPSTVSRELRRNAATRSGRLDYRATTAQWHADLRAKRPKPAKLAVNDRLRSYVQDRLAGRVQRPDGGLVAGPHVAWIGRASPREIAYLAHSVETEALGRQSGIQDQLCAAHGGVKYIEIDNYPHARVSRVAAPDEVLWELERRLSLVYLGKSHCSSDVHEKVIRELSDSGPG